jgi:DAK2 domain fusion protein YloV
VSGYADLDADAVRACCRETLAALGRAREEIDALNVYPVPDGDTGTNLYLTVESALEEVEARPDDGDLLRTLRAATHGALLGARGNSGVILSQLMRGASEVLVTASHEPVAQRTRSALAAAAEAAYAAVAHPVEGTILTVARAAAEAAAVEPSEDFATVLKAAASGAAEALRHTPEQLEPLRRAGVVDAGGRGLVVVLDALVATVTGDRPMSLRAPVALPQPQVADVERRRAGGPAFEVMYLLEARPDAVDRLRAELEPLGDSLLVVGGDGLFNVHVHVDDAGAAVEAGVRAGRPYRIAITHFGDQVTAGDEATSDRTRAVIALAPGEGLALLAAEAGARVVHGAPTRRPATRDVLEAIQGAHAREIVVLPNDSDTLPVAEAAAEYARSAGLRVAVIPSRASVQVLAALAVHDPGRHFEDDVVAMTAAARATRHGEVTTAVREALTSAGVCRPGDVLGLLDGDVVMIGADVRAVATDLLDRMLAAGGELVTLVLGEDADPGLGRGLQEHLARAHRSAESCVYLGGQPHYPLLIGVE